MVYSPCPGITGSAPGVARHATILASAIAVCCSAPALAAQADLSHGGEGWARFLDLTNPYVSLAYAYDSNLLRLDDRTPSIGSRSDEYATLGLGFSSDLQSGQQRFVVNGEFTPRRYNSHSEFDYQGGNFAAVWHWAESSTLTGTAGYHYARTMRDFANELSPKRVDDIRTENRAFGSADLDLQDNWIVGVRGEFADITFEPTSSLNLQKSTGTASVTYASTAGNEIGFDLTAVRGNYVNSSGTDYNQYTVGPTLKWKFTVRTQLTAMAGYISRSYTGNGGRYYGLRPNYSGAVANFALTIADAGRGSLTATAYQEVSNLTDEIPDYALVDGLSVQPAWTLSNGMTVRLRGSYEHRDFRDSSGNTARIDDVGHVSGFLDWPIGRHFKLSVGTTVERRSSTRLYQAYEFLQQQIQVTGTL